ncbi:MAG: hypothetical protein U0892_21580 [Pirellulales bacterium]
MIRSSVRAAEISRSYLQAPRLPWRRGGNSVINAPANNTTNISAASASLAAGGQIGASDLSNPSHTGNDNAIELAVDTVAASAVNGLYLPQRTGDLTVGHVNGVVINVTPQRVNFALAPTANNLNGASLTAG